MLNHMSGPFIIAKGAPPTTNPRTPESFSHTNTLRRVGERDGVEMRFGPGCQRLSDGECAERFGGPHLGPRLCPWLIRPICRDGTWVPPRSPNLHAVTHPPNSCQKHSMRVPQRWIYTRTETFLSVFLQAGSPLKPVFICCRHPTKDVNPEGASIGSSNSNKSLSHKQRYLDLITAKLIKPWLRQVEAPTQN